MDPRSHDRPGRDAARRAEYFVKEIAQQEEETRSELHNLAQYQERSAHIETEPTKVVSLKLTSAKGHELLRRLARADPAVLSGKAHSFETLRFNSDAAKQKYEDLISRPVVIADDQTHERVGTDQLIVIEDVEFAPSTAAVRKPTFASVQESANFRHQTPPVTPYSHHFGSNRRLADLPLAVQRAVHQHQSTHFRQPCHEVSRPFRLPQIARLVRSGAGPFNTTGVVMDNNLGETKSTIGNENIGQPRLLSPLTPEAAAAAMRLVEAERARRGSSPAPINAPPLSFENAVPMPLGVPLQTEPRPTALIIHGEMGGIRDIRNLPPRSLPEHMSYRIGPRQHQRLMKVQPPPNGWEGCTPALLNTDHSDPRFWAAPTLEDQNNVWRALALTVRHYSSITREPFLQSEAVLLPFGYDAAYNQLHHRFSQWCFSSLGFAHEWTKYGRVTHRLFKLDRWYGLLEDYEYAPNWPIRRKGFSGRIMQNPDCFACRECIGLDVFCHGHREDYKARCKPCLDNGRSCSKTLA